MRIGDLHPERFRKKQCSHIYWLWDNALDCVIDCHSMTTLLPPLNLVKNIILKSITSKGVLHGKITSSFWHFSSYGIKAETTNAIKMIHILGRTNRAANGLFRHFFRSARVRQRIVTKIHIYISTTILILKIRYDTVRHNSRSNSSDYVKTMHNRDFRHSWADINPLIQIQDISKKTASMHRLYMGQKNTSVIVRRPRWWGRLRILVLHIYMRSPESTNSS